MKTPRPYRPARFFLILLLFCALIPHLPPAAYGQNENVPIPDPVLKRSLLLALKKPVGSEITSGEMASLTELSLSGYQVGSGDDRRWVPIKSFSGLEHAAALRSLALHPNDDVRDLSPIKDLGKLTALRLPYNNITDLAMISGLMELTLLDLSGNWELQDLAPLSGLPRLTELSLRECPVTDLEPLRGLKSLRSLDVTGIAARDFSPLSALTDLISLNLAASSFTDLSPLSALAQLENLNLSVPSVTDFGPLSSLRKLRVLVLSGNHATDISPLSPLKELRSLDLLNNLVADASPLSGLTNLSSLILAGNRLRDVEALKPLTGLRTLDLRGNEIDFRTDSAGAAVLKVLREAGVSVEWRDQLVDDSEDLIPGGYLRALLRYHASVPNNRELAPSDLESITRLRSWLGPAYLNSERFSNLKGLEKLINLSRLQINGTRIADLTPLAGLRACRKTAGIKNS